MRMPKSQEKVLVTSFGPNYSRMFALSLILVVVNFHYLTYAEPVIMPPRTRLEVPERQPTGTPVVLNDSHQLGQLPPYEISIIEGQTVNMLINSAGSLTVNLNRAIPEDITVTLSVRSAPNLIKFVGEVSNVTNNLTPTYDIIYKADMFGDRVVQFVSMNSAGHAQIVCKVTKQPTKHEIVVIDKMAYTSVNIAKKHSVDTLIDIVGWIYFFAWSSSFYFQVILNYQRKSVVGLNFDFLALNLIGFTFLSIYNASLLFSSTVRQNYYDRYAYSRISVEYQDLIFAVHAVVITILTVIQCFIYERSEQKVSYPAGGFVILAPVAGLILYIISIFNVITLLDVILYLSYVKLTVTLIKYMPQAYMNYQRKATTGWSIHNILLDFTGGTFSILQMFLSAYNYDNWISIFGNFTKFGLGALSMIFDILFMIQHYVLYKNSSDKEEQDDLEESSDSVPAPVLSESLRSSNYAQTAANDDNNQI